jgi:YegS/Rv2252/BmrU family lipid kinase
MTDGPVVFLVNPMSAAGATARAIRRVETAIRERFRDVRIVFTEQPGHATALASDLGRDAELVVSVGGDGTANEVVNGLAALEPAHRPALGVLPAGTGCDLVRSIGMPRDLLASLDVLKNGERRPTDWIEVEVNDADGRPARRVCINVTGFGMNGEIVARANRSSKRLGGRLTFALATARTAVTWKSPLVAIQWEGPDGTGAWEGRLASVFVANGHFCGGGMHVGPRGRMDDGLVELTILPELPLLTSARHARRLYDGTLASTPGVRTATITRLEARVSNGETVLVDVDGEQPGRLPISLEVRPAAIQVAGHWAAEQASETPR